MIGSNEKAVISYLPRSPLVLSVSVHPSSPHCFLFTVFCLFQGETSFMHQHCSCCWRWSVLVSISFKHILFLIKFIAAGAKNRPAPTIQCLILKCSVTVYCLMLNIFSCSSPCLLNARTLSCCTGVCASSLGLRVALICVSFSLLGCLPLQDHQTLQHKSDWQCITAAIFLSRRDTKCKLLTGT